MDRRVTLAGADESVVDSGETATREPQLLLTAEQTADLLNVHRSTVYDLLRRGDLPSVKLGRRRLIYRQSLVKFIVRLEGDEPP